MLLRYRVQGVVRPVAVATQKGVEVTLGTGWQRRWRELNRLRLLRLLYARRSSAQHGHSGRHFVTKRCGTSAQDKTMVASAVHRVENFAFMMILSFVHSRPGLRRPLADGSLVRPSPAQRAKS